MPTREELQSLAQLRLRESEALYDEGLYDGCVYLCGYVVELALKACICATLAIDEYPEESFFLTHQFDKLKLLAGLQSVVTVDRAELFSNWSVATRWKPDWRYQTEGTYSRAEAKEVLESIRSEPNGVLKFLAQRWHR